MSVLKSVIVVVYVACAILVNTQDADEDKCEPSDADDCFMDVSDDLRLVFDPVNNFLQASNDTAIVGLCNDWIDSLNCVGEIIDETCKDEVGRSQFDTWNEGLKRVVDFLCHEDQSTIKMVGETVHCWSILKFIQCTETKAKLTSVADLLGTPLNKAECELLEDTFTRCNAEATNNHCQLSTIISHILTGAKEAFFSKIDCNAIQPETGARTSHGGVQIHPSLFAKILTSLVLFALLI